MSKSIQNSLNLAARVLFAVLFLPAGISKPNRMWQRVPKS